MFITTQVGSWPRSKELLKALRSYQKGQISRKEFDRVADDEVLRTVRLQEKAGLDIIVDGEHRRVLDGLGLDLSGGIPSRARSGRPCRCRGGAHFGRAGDRRSRRGLDRGEPRCDRDLAGPQRSTLPHHSRRAADRLR